MIETPPGKPRVGDVVYYFNPKLTTRIGYSTGYGGRGEGPYAALVVNNLGAGLTLIVHLDTAPIDLKAVPHADEDHGPDGHYWDWRTPIEKARAVKELNEAKAKEAAEAA